MDWWQECEKKTKWESSVWLRRYSEEPVVEFHFEFATAKSVSGMVLEVAKNVVSEVFLMDIFF